MTTVLDDDDGPLLNLGRGLVKHRTETLDHEVGPRVVQPKQNDAGDLPTAGSEDFAEIQVKGQYDSLLLDGLPEDLTVRKPLQPLVSKMNSVVAL
jgi:hypothetical protein